MPKLNNRARRIVARRRSLSDRDEAINMDLVGARAALLTAIWCLERHNAELENAMALNLRRAALRPVDDAIAELKKLQ